MNADTELFKLFMDNAGFKRWMTDTVFGLTYNPGGPCRPQECVVPPGRIPAKQRRHSSPVQDTNK